MKRIIKGSKLKCKKDIFNIFNQILFEKNKIYEVLYVDNEKIKVMVYLNHNLIGNEYNQFELNWILENFDII